MNYEFKWFSALYLTRFVLDLSESLSDEKTLPDTRIMNNFTFNDQNCKSNEKPLGGSR